jgi:superfamily I DNA and/or RNA helicase
MHSSISLFSNNTFYDGKIIYDPNFNDHHNSYLDGGICDSYSFIYIEDGKEVESDRSLQNMVEVVVLDNIVCKLEKGTLNTPTFK